jgi:hypothetical protein
MLYGSLCWYSCFLAQSDTQCAEYEATERVASQSNMSPVLNIRKEPLTTRPSTILVHLVGLK